MASAEWGLPTVQRSEVSLRERCVFRMHTDTCGGGATVLPTVLLLSEMLLWRHQPQHRKYVCPPEAVLANCLIP